MRRYIEDGSIVLGGVCHRFQHDDAIEAFRKYNDYDVMAIHTDGSVYGVNDMSHLNEPPQGRLVGWIM